MFIDSDVIFTPEDVKTLLDMDKDIACGAYLMNGSHYPIVEEFNNNYFLENGSFHFLSRDDLNKKIR